VYLFCSQCLFGSSQAFAKAIKCVFLGYYHFKKCIKVIFYQQKRIISIDITFFEDTPFLVLNQTFFICSTGPSYTILWCPLIIPTSSQSPTQRANDILSPPLLKDLPPPNSHTIDPSSSLSSLDYDHVYPITLW